MRKRSIFGTIKNRIENANLWCQVAQKQQHKPKLGNKYGFANTEREMLILFQSLIFIIIIYKDKFLCSFKTIRFDELGVTHSSTQSKKKSKKSVAAARHYGKN